MIITTQTKAATKGRVMIRPIASRDTLFFHEQLYHLPDEVPEQIMQLVDTAVKSLGAVEPYNPASSIAAARQA